MLEQAASLMFGLDKNHGFIDGNKRIAVVATDAFLHLNGWELLAVPGEIHDFVSRCSDAGWTEAAVLVFIRSHNQPLV